MWVAFPFFLYKDEEDGDDVVDSGHKDEEDGDDVVDSGHKDEEDGDDVLDSGHKDEDNRDDVLDNGHKSEEDVRVDNKGSRSQKVFFYFSIYLRYQPFSCIYSVNARRMMYSLLMAVMTIWGQGLLYKIMKYI